MMRWCNLCRCLYYYFNFHVVKNKRAHTFPNVTGVHYTNLLKYELLLLYTVKRDTSILNIKSKPYYLL